MFEKMNKLRASKLLLKQVGTVEAKAFLNEYHYQGYAPCSWCYGLYNNDELIQLMSFGKPRYTKKFDYELIRLCTKKDFIVYGGASRLLKHFRQVNVGSIISYCNRDKFDGTVYHSLGFKSKGITKGYYYEKDGIRYHRSCFTKKRCLLKWPDKYDENWTESRIMEAEGYTKVIDVMGQETFVLDELNCKWYIYEIECNGYHYIGQHKYRNLSNDNYNGSGTIIKRLTKKYPFTKTIIVKDITTQEIANELEKKYISESRELYKEFNINILNGGQNGYVNTAKRNSSGMLGKKHTEDAKLKMSISGKGKHNHKGENNPCYGKKWTEEERQKLSLAHKNDNIGKRWYTNGIDNVFSRECPEGYYLGRTCSEKLRQACLDNAKKTSIVNRKYELTNEIINDAHLLSFAEFRKKYNYSRATYYRIKNV